MNTHEIVTQLKQCEAFFDLTESQINTIINMSELVTLPKGTEFITEDNETYDIFILLQGDVDIRKKNVLNNTVHSIRNLSKNEMIGSMSFVEYAKRSASAVTLTEAQLLKIDPKKLIVNKNLHDIHQQILANLAKDYAKHLRETNEITVKSMQKRISTGVLMVSMFYIMAFYTLFLSAFKFINQFTPTTTPLSVAMIFLLGLIMYIVIKRSGYPLENYGLTLKDWKKTLVQSFLYTLPIMLLLLLAKFIAINTIPALSGQSLFDPTAIAAKASSFSVYVYIFSILAYSVFSPIQEFITRGALQSSLQMFVGDETPRKVWSAIILSNLIFATAHVHISLVFVIAAFVPGLFWGWLYSKQRSLLGVSFSHILLGVWALFIVGMRGLN